MGDPFEVQVKESGTERKETLQVPSDKPLLRVLTEVGFMKGGQKGSCAISTVRLCGGEAVYKSKMWEDEKGVAMRCCVDRGIGRTSLEIA